MIRLLGSLVFACALLPAQPVTDLLADKLLVQIEGVDTELEGVLGVAIIDLNTGDQIQYHADTVFPLASVIKIAVAAEAYGAAQDHRIEMSGKVTLEPGEAKPGGDLYAAVARAPQTLTVEELVRHMIVSSDNTAANRLISTVGMERVNRRMHGLGFRNMTLRRMMLDSAAVSRGDENVATPLEVANLLRLLHERRLTGAPEILEFMKQVDGDFRKTAPPAVPVAAKDGEYPGTRAEAALVLLPGRPYVAVVCATFLRPGANPIPEIAALIHAHFERLAKSNRYGNRLD